MNVRVTVVLSLPFGEEPVNAAHNVVFARDPVRSSSTIVLYWQSPDHG